MSVNLRKKEISKGRYSLYLDFYPPVKLPDTDKETRREFLRLYLYEKPKTIEEKRHNKETLIIADKIKAERQIQLQNEEYNVFSKINNKKDFIAFFEETALQRMQSQTNYQNWMSSLKHLENYTNGRCLMKDVNEEFCEGFKKYLLSANRLNSKHLKLARNSTVSYFNKFKATVKEAYQKKFLKENPMQGINGIKEAETKREFLTIEEVNKLIKTECPNTILKAASLYSAMTGLRWSDIIDLTWGDIQYSKESGYFIYIMEDKTDKPDYHFISKQAVQLLGEPKEKHKKIFQGLKYSDTNNKLIQKWVNDAGINKKITFHCFRHTYATILLNSGEDIYTVNKILRHKRISTTEIYSNLLDQRKKKAANSIKFEL